MLANLRIASCGLLASPCHAFSTSLCDSASATAFAMCSARSWSRPPFERPQPRSIQAHASNRQEAACASPPLPSRTRSRLLSPSQISLKSPTLTMPVESHEGRLSASRCPPDLFAAACLAPPDSQLEVAELMPLALGVQGEYVVPADARQTPEGRNPAWKSARQRGNPAKLDKHRESSCSQYCTCLRTRSRTEESNCSCSFHQTRRLSA